ncbi:hypothetical protein [Sulfobacillus thermosulfidooxidans]|uniref:hypothetical protein n=1 Tax=Sulfobacillus thermosulfidooxidans TaxID=28034 RepID=UPI001111BAC4|nr:hypothetical protein [Sulfobacillus thermosulfidooxidans]
MGVFIRDYFAMRYTISFAISPKKIIFLFPPRAESKVQRSTDETFTEPFFHEIYRIIKEREILTHRNLLNPYTAETYLIDVIGEEPCWIFRYTTFENISQPLKGKSFNVFCNPRDMVKKFYSLLADVNTDEVQKWDKTKLAEQIFEMIETALIGG